MSDRESFVGSYRVIRDEAEIVGRNNNNRGGKGTKCSVIDEE